MSNRHRHIGLFRGVWSGLLIGSLASVVFADARPLADDPAAQAQVMRESGQDEKNVSAPGDGGQETAFTTSSFFSGGFEFGGSVGDATGTVWEAAGGPCELPGVLVLPLGDSDPNEIRTLREDLAVMTEILDDSVRPLLIGAEAFSGYGDASGGQNTVNRCTYLEGYGAVFVLQVDFPLMWRPGYERRSRGPGRHDLIWETTRERVLGARQTQGGAPAVFEADRVARLKKNLIAALVHAANVRGVADGEWIIVAVQSVPGPSGQTGFSYFYRRYVCGVSAGASEEGRSEPSVLSLRVKKDDIARFAEGALSEEAFAKSVTAVVY